MSVNQGVKIPAAMISAGLGDAYYTQGNAMLRMLQTLVQPNVISMTLTAPPGSPADGDTYIIATGATGAWAGKAKNIAYWSADPTVVTPGWEFYSPVKGWVVGNQVDGQLYIYSGTAWVSVTPTMTSTVGGFVPTPPNDATLSLDGTGAFSAPVSRKVSGINTQTASYTLVLADAGALVRMNVAGANNATIPTNASVAFAVGTVVTIRQIGAGATTIVAAGGVTINNPGSSLVIRKQLATVQLIKVATDTWDLLGDITGA